MSLNYNGKLINRAKDLRKGMTKEEKKIWYDFLSSYEIRFQRQKIIANYIVDFYCHKAKLIVELDGSQHYSEEGIQYDEERTKNLKQAGVEIIRFSNLDVIKNFEGVCIRIDEKVKARMK